MKNTLNLFCTWQVKLQKNREQLHGGEHWKVLYFKIPLTNTPAMCFFSDEFSKWFVVQFQVYLSSLLPTSNCYSTESGPTLCKIKYVHILKTQYKHLINKSSQKSLSIRFFHGPQDSGLGLTNICNIMNHVIVLNKWLR